MKIEKCNDEFQRSWFILLPYSSHLHISQIHGVLPIYLPIYSYTNYCSLTKGKFFSNHPTRNFTTNSLLSALLQRVSSYEARHSVLLHEALRITFATNPLQLALRNGCTRVSTLCHPHTHTYTHTNARAMHMAVIRGCKVRGDRALRDTRSLIIF